MCSFILIAVTGSLSLYLALTRFGDLRLKGEGGGQIKHGPDFTSLTTVARPLVAPTNVLDQHPVQPTLGFFFDIGSSSSSVRGSVRSKHLEKKGWSGICAVPFPGDFSGRSCRVVALPVSGSSGEKMMVPDCSRGPPQTLERIFGSQTTPCPDVEANTVGIVDLLSLAAAPPVIDYVALDTDGTELRILNNFPFDDFCVRSWTVKHNYDGDVMLKIRHVLEVAQGCRVREGAGEYWARCTCEKKTDAVPSVGDSEESRRVVTLSEDAHATNVKNL